MNVLVVGQSGQLGWELRKALAPLGQVAVPDRGGMDLMSADAIRAAVRAHRPDVIVNAAAYTAVDKAEAEPEAPRQVNATAPAILAEEAKRTGALLIHFSTDYVFDGESRVPYREDDAPNPLNVYGRTKLEGEQAVAGSGADHLILRTAWVFSARRSNFVLTMLKLAREREEIRVVNDQFGSPTWARALAEDTAALLGNVNRLRQQGGVYHLTAAGEVSRFDFATAIIDRMRALTGQATGWARVIPVTTAEYPLPAKRPYYSVLGMEKIRRAFGIEPADWSRHLDGCLAELAAQWRVT